VHHAAKAARQAGVFVVVSAGNDNGDACGQSPANAAELMVVGATDFNDARASFSNYGSCVDVFAPGVSVDAANYLVVPPYITTSGTSFSAPYVAGVAAALYGTYPNDTPDQIPYAIRDGGTSGVISNPGANSPNLLLFSQLPAPVQVSIQGPSYAGPFSECSWNAEVRAGRGPFQFQWSGLLTGSGSGISGLISSSGGLQVQVSDALSGSATTTIGVTFDPEYSGFTCQ
jgi:aqualysin 1